MHTLRNLLLIVPTLWGLLYSTSVSAQELDAQVTINRQQVQGSSTSVFENLETALTAMLNDRQWTNLQFARHEKIRCNFNISVTKYIESDNKFECKLTVQSQRPVYGSNYTSTTFSVVDNNFNFTFQEFDKLEFRPDVIDNDLTAMIGYYAYLIIGWDLDTMSPLGGTEILQQAMDVCNNSQSLLVSAKGWKAFEDGKNRYAIIHDYLDSGLEPFRKMQYQYYREGLDTMAENVDRGRSAVTTSIQLLGEARSNKPMSMLPQLFTEFKRDELVGIYQGKGAPKDKEKVFEILSTINASQANYWNKLRQ